MTERFADRILQTGDKVIVGRAIIEVGRDLADSLVPGDAVLGVAATGSLRRLPAEVLALVDEAVGSACEAFAVLSRTESAHVDHFFDTAASLLEDDEVFDAVARANESDVGSARARGRSTTRLELTPKMRTDMVDAMRMWRDYPVGASVPVSRHAHEGWTVEEWRAPLGVIGFVFEGRPNVFADATGVLKSGNTVVFRIGSDALGTATALMEAVIRPSLSASGLPPGSVVLVESPEHAAGWALFSDERLSLAVARGSGDAVAELGSIARQAGIPVSLHGTGGAWVLVGESAEPDRLSSAVEHSLDRKVCNTMNVVCIPRSVADALAPVVWDAAKRAAARRGTVPLVRAVNGAEKLPGISSDTALEVDVVRPNGIIREVQVTVGAEGELGHEFEWEDNPEFHLVVVDSMEHAIDLFNRFSPRFIASVISGDDDEVERVWSSVDAPFFGNGFTRWVDGQFALHRPELGLSNWQAGRLLARSGILSGDSAHSVRLRVDQTDPGLHR